ncbi:STAS domain-containing protein [Mycobacterium aquaticum]|uniref:Anti-sigma factor antagonist n=1 Tax=Mycobacterium aquaticum TaxID=1927124 RepID=A0A1W9ZXT9_9MYCO|nr:STAS domain-containing protein [Mycobacterium aquaticum]ORA22525.1 anti-anti-sigma factor [Mycobacterium aquaticum]
MTSQPIPTEGPSSTAPAVSCAVEERRDGDISVVAVSGTVDMLTAPRLEEAIRTATKSSPSAVVVDLSGVDFLASAGMGVLVASHNALQPAMRFAVVADGPATSRPLKLVGIDDVVELFATLDEALAAVRN